MDIFSQNCYRKILKSELEKRCTLNPLYSLRAFARDLEVNPARLSNILTNKHGLSGKSAKDWAEKIGLNDEETSYFCDLVISQHARKEIDKELAKSRLLKFAQKRTDPLDLEYFKVISDWYHFAILELTYLDGFQSDIKWIARSLNIKEVLVNTAIKRLEKLELIEWRENKLVACEDFSRTSDGVPSKSMRKYHRQVIEKALMAIELQGLENRDITNVIGAFDSSKMKEAKEYLRNTRKYFIENFFNKGKCNKVYCIALQFFELTNFIEEKTK